MIRILYEEINDNPKYRFEYKNSKILDDIFMGKFDMTCIPDNMKYYLVIDLGGTFVKGGVVDENGKIIAKGTTQEILSDKKLLEGAGLELPLRFQ